MISDLQTIENCSYILNQSQLQITKVQFQNVQPVLTLELKPVYLKYLKTRFCTVFRQSLDSPTPNSLTNCGFSLAHSRKFAQNSSSKHFVAKARRITQVFLYIDIARACQVPFPLSPGAVGGTLFTHVFPMACST